MAAPEVSQPADHEQLQQAARPNRREWDIQAYHLSDDLSGMVILAMVIFSPWALGTTQPWAIHCMNVAEYALGLLLLLKVILREARSCPAPRWDNFSPRSGTFTRHEPAAVRQLKLMLAAVTVAVLAECLVSAWNAAATYTPETRVFHYKQHLEWLPHSFDADRSWSSFWNYLGLAAAFWAITDWLAGVTPAEERNLAASGNRTGLVPARLRTLLWVLAINGTLLGAEAIFQRVLGSNKLLFLVPTRNSDNGITQFGPYAYRSNAAQYFNLLWPLCLGFWWCLQRQAGGRAQAHHWLLAGVAVMAACPIISTTRGGALISAGMLLATLLYQVLARKKSPRPAGIGSRSKPQSPRRHTSPDTLPAAVGPADEPTSPGQNQDSDYAGRELAAVAARSASFPSHSGNRESAWLPVLFVTATLVLGGCFGWHSLAPRMGEIATGFEGRQVMHNSAEPMTRDYPLFGTGPGSFATVFQLYRFSEAVYWSEQAYDDWLETRITFGWLGFGLLLAALALAGLRGFLPGGVRDLRPLVLFAWLALSGCLVHARFDIPFQIHSTLFLFLVICAILLNLGRISSGSRGGRQRP